MIEREIDYMQCSLYYREETCKEKKHAQIRGMGFYTRGYEDELGVRRYFGNNKSEKAFCVYSGRALNNYRAVNWKIPETIENLLSNGANFSRIDLCITEYVDDNLFLVSDVEHWYQLGLINSTIAKLGARKIVALEEGYNQRVETLYIGDIKQRGKKGIFRAYDKGIELDLGKFLITRAEYEDRGEKAHTSAKRIANGASVGSVFKTRFDVSTEGFRRIVDSPAIDTSRGAQIDKGNKDTDYDKRWTWLFNQVAPALRDAIQFDDMMGKGDANLQRFLELALIHTSDKGKS